MGKKQRKKIGNAARYRAHLIREVQKHGSTATWRDLRRMDTTSLEVEANAWAKRFMEEEEQRRAKAEQNATDALESFAKVQQKPQLSKEQGDIVLERGRHSALRQVAEWTAVELSAIMREVESATLKLALNHIVTRLGRALHGTVGNG